MSTTGSISFSAASVINHPPLRVTLFFADNGVGRMLVSTPEAAYGGVLANSAASTMSLLRRAQHLAREKNLQFLELRNFQNLSMIPPWQRKTSMSPSARSSSTIHQRLCLLFQAEDAKNSPPSTPGGESTALMVGFEKARGNYILPFPLISKLAAANFKKYISPLLRDTIWS